LAQRRLANILKKEFNMPEVFNAMILITGGAGYIGSVVAEELLKEGYEVVILDNLRQGHRDAVPAGAEFVLADIGNCQAMEDVFRRFRIEAVIHMAADSIVHVSMTDPRKHFQNNVVAGLNLLDAMLKSGVRKIVFSSSAAVYGDPKTTPIEEGHPKVPTNAYGESKLFYEGVLRWYRGAYALDFVALRYFNAAGASQRLGEDHHPETHLIPNVLRAALDKSSPVTVFGTDYPTRDGSCVRDYVHVVDIARAHVLALEKLTELSGHVYNLGNGEGYTNMEVVGTARKVTGVNIPTKIGPRRSGDPATLVASSMLAQQELGWKTRYPELESIIGSSWQWMKKHPQGYNR
jgi:UDP-glucose 4-epimerase